MKKLKLLLLLLLFQPCLADSIDSPFFELPLSSEWEVSRSTTGLWRFERSEPFVLSGTVLVNRLRTTPEMYLQGTLELWKTQGETEPAFDGERMECLIKPAQGDPIFKYVCRRDDVLLVASFTFPVKHTDEAMNTAQQLMQGVVIEQPVFRPEVLDQAVKKALAGHQNTPEDLAIAAEIRTEMTSFRQDWEPYFTADPPPLFSAFLAYLEARYDAAFVVEHGEEMGMPESILESRLKSIDNRRKELEEVMSERHF